MSIALSVPLSELLGLIESAFPPEVTEGAWLLRFQGEGDGLTLGLLDLASDGAHPLDGLLGFRADDTWSAAGLIVHGTARAIGAAAPGAADQARRRIRAVHAVNLEGEVASVLRSLEDGERMVAGPAEGRMADCCKRILGLPTAPPPCPVLHWYASAWLSAVLAEVSARPSRPPGWRQIVALHPAAGPGYVRPDRFASHIAERRLGQVSWGSLLAEFRSGSVPYGDLCGVARPIVAELLADLTPTVAHWMDEGMFARWLAGLFPDPVDLMIALAELLPAAEVGHLVSVLQLWELW